MRQAFIVTSALNTRFGVYNTKQRMSQTLETIISIKERVPDAFIILAEMAGEPLQPDQAEVFNMFCDVLLNFTQDQNVKQIYSGTNNWDVVKNSTEIYIFGQVLKTIIDNPTQCAGIDRFFKLSGRYTLTDDFNIADYNTDKYKNKIVFAERRNSQFDLKITGGVAQQFMSRCWSFPASDLIKIQKTFNAMRLCQLDILQKGGYLDIEHLLFLYLNYETNVLEVKKMGVQGLLGPNGTTVRD